MRMLAAMLVVAVADVGAAAQAVVAGRLLVVGQVRARTQAQTLLQRSLFTSLLSL